MKKIVYLSICLLVLWLSFLCGRRSAELKQIEIVKTDTLTVETIKIVVDTQYVDKPVPYKVEVRDTLYIRDTVRPFLLIETKRYTDNKTYDLQVSGIDVEIDWIKTYPKVVYRAVARTEYVLESPKAWNLYAEVTISIMENVNAMNLCGGISYTKDRWMIDAQVGREVLRGNNYVKVGSRYNFARF